MVTSPRRSESRNATGGSPHSCRAKSFSLTTFLKAYRGSFASVNKTKTQITKNKTKRKHIRFLDPTHFRG